MLIICINEFGPGLPAMPVSITSIQYTLQHRFKREVENVKHHFSQVNEWSKLTTP